MFSGKRGRRAVDCAQGNKSVAGYSLEFRILAAVSGFGDCALRSLFRRWLSLSLKDELAVCDMSTNLEELIALSIHLDNSLQERCRKLRYEQSRSPPEIFRSHCSTPKRLESTGHYMRLPVAPATPSKEPMQLGGGHICTRNGCSVSSRVHASIVVCQGHQVVNCPRRPPRSHRKSAQLQYSDSQDPVIGKSVTRDTGLDQESNYMPNVKRLEITVEVYATGRSVKTTALVDSGSDKCFIDPSIVEALRSIIEKLSEIKLDGRVLAKVKFITSSIQLRCSGNHIELCLFFVMPWHTVLIVSGLPWLNTHIFIGLAGLLSVGVYFATPTV